MIRKVAEQSKDRLTSKQAPLECIAESSEEDERSSDGSDEKEGYISRMAPLGKRDVDSPS